MATSSQRIAKNTLFLYLRMMLVLFVSLYTSRVILQTLGATDYGIYNVVGGVIAMMAFLNSALSSSTSRYLTYHLGKRDIVALKKTFSASLNLHILVAITVLFIAETGGLWFLYEKLTIPADRLDAAFWVFQFTIIATMVTFTQVPYNASLISHENMTIYAYVGVYEAVSKLIISYLLMISPIDKLIFYSSLLMINSILICLFYRFYATRKYDECRFRLIWDKSLYKELVSYSGWDLFGNISSVCQGQGINMLLNIFFGPTVNAARAISFQMQNSLKQFAINFLMAVRPQVIKNYAEGKYDEMYNLAFTSLRLSLLLMLILVMPILFNINFVLDLWLGDAYPPETPTFAIIVLITALFDVVESAQDMAFHAIGRIKTGSVVCGGIMILSLPISYIALHLGAPAYMVFVVVIITMVANQILTLLIMKSYINFSIMQAYYKHYFPVIFVAILSSIIPYYLQRRMTYGWGKFFAVSVVLETGLIILGWIIAVRKDEKKKVFIYITNKIKK